MTKDAINCKSLSEEMISPTVFELPDVVFRDYDIRGYAQTQINDQFALRLGATLAAMFRNHGHSTAYVGRDCRLSSPALAEALRTGLTGAGIDVIDLGAITTPALNFAIHQGGKSACGIMVTASHNPSEYNGFKIIVRDKVIAGDTLQQIKSMMASDLIFIGQSGQLFTEEIIPHYLQKIIHNCSINQPFKMVIDAGNGAAGPLAISLFEQLGCSLVPLFCEPDGHFPNHDPNPSDKSNLQLLRETVQSTQADLGLAFDGDGDRLVAISGNGEIIWPDQLMMIFARDILLQNPNSKIVFDVKSSDRLNRLVHKYSGDPVICKTGHAHVREAVQQTGALLGGEFSGHIFFNDRWHGFDDGLYAAVRLLEILCAHHQNKAQTNCQSALLDQIISEFEDSAYTPELLIPVSESEKFSLMKTLATNCKFNGAKIITIDGLRVEYPQGWGLIRASNTSAYLTMRFEANNESELERIKKRFSDELSPFINHVEQYL